MFGKKMRTMAVGVGFLALFVLFNLSNPVAADPSKVLGTIQRPNIGREALFQRVNQARESLSLLRVAMSLKWNSNQAWSLVLRS
jgi:hypothetical protein